MVVLLDRRTAGRNLHTAAAEADIAADAVAVGTVGSQAARRRSIRKPSLEVDFDTLGRNPDCSLLATAVDGLAVDSLGWIDRSRIAAGSRSCRPGVGLPANCDSRSW